MSDLIRREDVFKAVVGLTIYKTVDDIEILCEASVADSEGWLGGIRDALREVEYIPSAEPERKKGKWLPHPGDEDWDVCSVCGTGCKRRKHSADGWMTEYNYPYCPNCGSEMARGEDENA